MKRIRNERRPIAPRRYAQWDEVTPSPIEEIVASIHRVLEAPPPLEPSILYLSPEVYARLQKKHKRLAQRAARKIRAVKRRRRGW